VLYLGIGEHLRFAAPSVGHDVPQTRAARPDASRPLAVTDSAGGPARRADGHAAGDAHGLHLVGPETYANWDEIYVDNVVRVYRLLYAKVGNRADAEDLTTEVFLSAYGPLRVDASRGEVRAYLAATARTTLARHWRSRLGVELTHIDADIAVRELDDEPSPSAAPKRAKEVLAALPERHRRILELRFLETRSVREAAHEMGISIGNAKVLQHRALRMAARLAQGGEA
jgi:RNA polymerase sigma factor (sigma-70 family)